MNHRSIQKKNNLEDVFQKKLGMLSITYHANECTIEFKEQQNEVPVEQLPPTMIPDNFDFNCPHCFLRVGLLASEFNCQIFRCGFYHHNAQPIDPHMPKEQCEKLIPMDYLEFAQLKSQRMYINQLITAFESSSEPHSHEQNEENNQRKQQRDVLDQQMQLAITGCAKPFKVEIISHELRQVRAEPCDYI